MLDSSEYGLESTPWGVNIRVYAAPRASANRVVGVYNRALKVALTASPVEGAANKALVEFLAKVFGVPKSAVVLSSGHTSRNKTVAVCGITCEEALQRLLPSTEQHRA